MEVRTGTVTERHPARLFLTANCAYIVVMRTTIQYWKPPVRQTGLEPNGGESYMLY